MELRKASRPFLHIIIINIDIKSFLFKEKTFGASRPSHQNVILQPRQQIKAD